MSGREDAIEVKTKFRVLSTSPLGNLQETVKAFPLSIDMYTKIQSKLKIDPCFQRFFAAEGFLTSEFESFEGGYGLMVVLKRKSFVVTFDPATSTTFVLIIGLCTHEINEFITVMKRLDTEGSTLTAIVVSWISVTT